MSYSSKHSLRIITYSLAIVAALSFFVFTNNSSKLGGDAISGKSENGQYFVGSPRGYTEVTYREYQANKILAITVMIIWPITMIGLFYVEWERANAFGNRLKCWLDKFTRSKSRKKISRRNRYLSTCPQCGREMRFDLILKDGRGVNSLHVSPSLFEDDILGYGFYCTHCERGWTGDELLKMAKDKGLS